MPPTDAKITQAILAMTAARGREKTVCPSEVARGLEPDDWRPLMPLIREAAVALCRKGKLRITQGGEAVADLDNIHGPIRLAQADPH